MDCGSAEAAPAASPATPPRRVRYLSGLRERARRVDLAVVRRFIRVVPSEPQRVFVLTAVLGVLCGLTAVAFHLSIRFAEEHLIEQAMDGRRPWWGVLTVLCPAMGGLVGGVLLAKVVPDARGSGIPQVKVAYALKGGRLPFRQAVGKFVVSTIQIGSGASLGREGPTVQICAGVTSLVGRAAALSRESLRRLLPVGAAAGIAAAFNAPIAAVTFTIEEVVGDLDQTVLAGVVIAAAVAAAVERVVLGEDPVFDIPAGYGLHHAESLLLYVLLGVAAAVGAVVFTRSLLRLRQAFAHARHLPLWARPAAGGLVTGVLTVAALWLLGTGGVNGGGYETLSRALRADLTFRVLLALGAMKLAATVFSYASGGAGGLFAPALFVGGMLGGAVGVIDAHLFHHPSAEIGAFALVGMGAFFAGAIRAPITSVLIIFEMTGGYGLILPLMIANMTAYALARHWQHLPIYDALLQQDGIELPHAGQPAPHVLDVLQVGDAMTPDPVTLTVDQPAGDALDRLRRRGFSSAPVIDRHGHLVGLVSESKLMRAVANDGHDPPVGPLAGRRARLTPNQPLADALLLMDQHHTRQLAVVEPDQNHRLIGMLALSDIMRSQARALRGEHPDTPDTPADMREVDQP